MRTSAWRASWENSGGSALASEAFVDTGDTDNLSSRMATLRGAGALPGPAGKVLCDTVSCARRWRPGA